MWLLVGLGNPGAKYAKTRHNVGFMVLEEFADINGLTFKERSDYMISDGSIEGEKIILIEPLTFMNRSGSAVKKMVARHSIPPDRMIIIHDDLDLETGRLKIVKKGSSGGHKGVESIQQNLGTKEGIRVRFGIGRDPSVPTEVYVLSKFRKDEKKLIKDSLKKAVDAVCSIITDGADKAMNKFNA